MKKIIVGLKACICNLCINICFKQLQQNIKNINFISKNILPTPKLIFKNLNDYIISQKKAKKILSVAVYNHYKRLKYKYNNNIKIEKSNILLIGPTGSGKTLIIETLAKFLNVPFAITDATTLTEAGYVGEDIENIIQKLLQKCDYDIQKAQKGIVYIDEIDKLSRKSNNPSITRDVSGEGVQQGLLKLIEGTIAAIPPKGGRKHPNQDFLYVDTSEILFICGGSFDGINKIIQRRINKNYKIGFNANIKKTTMKFSDNKILKKIEPKDLIKFGLIPEFVGRLPILAIFNSLTEKELVEILYKPKNAIIKQYKMLFNLDGVKLKFKKKSLIEIAKKAIYYRLGARGLRGILEDILLDIMYKIPSKKNINQVIIDKDILSKKLTSLLIYNTKKIN